MNTQYAALIAIVLISLAGLASSLIYPENLPQIISFTGAVIPSLILLLRVEAVKGEVVQYHHAVNSKMDALLEVTAKSSKAEGVLEEKERSKE